MIGLVDSLARTARHLANPQAKRVRFVRSGWKWIEFDQRMQQQWIRRSILFRLKRRRSVRVHRGMMSDDRGIKAKVLLRRFKTVEFVRFQSTTPLPATSSAPPKETPPVSQLLHLFRQEDARDMKRKRSDASSDKGQGKEDRSWNTSSYCLPYSNSCLPLSSLTRS